MFGGAGLFGGMGGMGGMGGGRSRSAMFADDDDDMNGFSFSSGGMPGGMPRRPQPTRTSSAKRPPSPEKKERSEIVKPLKVTLEDLYSGTTKHLKVGRRLLDGTTEDKVLEVKIHPGWKSGTKIRFPHAGNELPTGESQDLVFVVEEKAPRRLQARRQRLDRQSASTARYRETWADYHDSWRGHACAKGRAVQKKGDLTVQWNVVFPDRLTPTQKEGLRKILGPSID
ncbi:hypothetical protein CPB84DRAFT_1764086 [Gymnopilus junonius]|uniref:Chaperone DnaJ C-terminal domain-containing protein n=1 Tax=Gymnopilus junonius TaxID=109634 RepID=A0A9P5TT58_GYMJU|nr:hypothetical protein CPB84DRAFT_1764086 [Gymnopilus junonius]